MTSSSTTIDTTPYNAAWNTWVTTGASTVQTVTSDAATTWYGWLNTDWDASRRRTLRINNHSAAQETPERQAERQAQRERIHAEAEARQAEADAQYKAASERAEKLLLSYLTKWQRRCLRTKRAFNVCAASGKKYRIERGRSGNVKELDKRHRPVASYCIHPSLAVPDADTMLAQKLLLQTDELEFLRIANRSAVLAGR